MLNVTGKSEKLTKTNAVVVRKNIEFAGYLLFRPLDQWALANHRGQVVRVNHI